jgi:CxxC motif-containing protein
MTCIVCPIGCSLSVEETEEITVTGNHCPRGAVYAREEILAPKRVVTATCGLNTPGAPHRLPVKTATPCPRQRIPGLLADIYALRPTPPVKTGEKLITNWRDSGVDVIACRTVS